MIWSNHTKIIIFDLDHGINLLILLVFSRYYPCTVSGSHHDYTKSRFHSNQSNATFTCRSNISHLATPTLNFDPNYFTYHAMRHNLILRTRGGRDLESTRDEWDLSCLHCRKYPHFMTYMHVVHEALVDPNGVVYTRTFKVRTPLNRAEFVE